jgi:hypothetical protein
LRSIINDVLIFIQALLMESAQQLTTPVLRHLVATGLAGQLVARGVPGGFMLVMKGRGSESTLAAQRGAPRLFRRLDTLAGFLRDLGVHSATVEFDQWDGPTT